MPVDPVVPATASAAVVIVLSTVPSEELGLQLARTLVDERLAACVNVLPPMTSIYRWQGAVQTDAERQLVIKTTALHVPALRARLHALHPYEVPEFLVVPVSDGSDGYLEWVRQQTGPCDN